MPANIVKTQADERRWDRAKRITKKQYGGIESKGKWPVVTHIFKKIKKGEQEKTAMVHPSMLKILGSLGAMGAGALIGHTLIAPGSREAQKRYANDPRYKKLLAKKKAGTLDLYGDDAMELALMEIAKEREKNADVIFWAAFNDELEKCGQVGMTAGEMVKRLAAVYRAGKATVGQKNILVNLRSIQKRGGDIRKYIAQSANRLPNV